MNTIFQIKSNKKSLLKTLFVMFSLLLVVSCTNDKVVDNGFNSEPNSPIGFVENNLEVLEGDNDVNLLEVTASKPVFENVTYELDVIEGDVSDLLITDKDGNIKDEKMILNGERLSTLLVSAPDNDMYTGDKEVVFSLKNLKGNGVFLADQNYSGNGVTVRTELKITIKDNDPIPPLVSFNEDESEVEEQAGSHTVSINISDATTKEETFDINFRGSADEGVHYSIPGLSNGVLTVTVPAGERAIDIPITIIDNTEKEDKTIVMELSNYSNGLFKGDITKHTVTILDDDIPTQIITLYATDASMIKGGSDGDKTWGNNELELSNKLPSSTKNTRSGMMKFDITGIDAAAVLEANVVITTYNESDASRWKQTEDYVGGPVQTSLHYMADDSWTKGVISWNGMNSDDFDKSAGRFKNEAVAVSTYETTVGDSGQTNIQHDYDVTLQLQSSEADNTLSFGIEVVPFTNGLRVYYRGTKNADTNLHPQLVIKVRTDL